MLKGFVSRSLKAKKDADTPEKFVGCMKNFGGASNVTLTLGEVDRKNLDEKKKKDKNQIKNISQYHEFVFESDGILMRLLPGFGTGVKIFLKPLKDVAEYVYDIVNKEHLDENGQCKRKTIVPYNSAGEEVKCMCGQEESIPQEYQNTNDDEEQEDPFKAVFKCKNPKCTKVYTSYFHYQKHMSMKTCVTRLRDSSSRDEFIEMYIAKNGISKQHQEKSFRETRNMHFHNDNLPEIDQLFINCKSEDIFEGHALPEKRKKSNLTEKHKVYLKKIYKDGMNSKRKANCTEVAKQMRYYKDGDQLVFSEDEWLTDLQIKSYWCSLTSEIRFPKNQKAKDDTDETQSRTQDEDSASYLDAMEEAQVEEEVMNSLDKIEESSNTDHPLVFHGINICALAISVKKARILKESDIHTLSIAELLKVLEAMGHYGVDGRSRRKIADLIVDHVSQNCDCLVFA